MLQITSGNINNSKNNKISFKQNITKEMVEAGKNLPVDSILSPASSKTL